MTKQLKYMLLKHVDIVYEKAVAIRRHIHAYPELSGQEKNTATFIASELKKIGLKPKFHINKTGVTATLKNGTGQTIVLRADTDALPIKENTGLVFSSKNNGVMHACGHDMHVASLLGAAQVLWDMKDAWSGTVVFLFQPSEEVEPGGAVLMIEENAFPVSCDAVFGLHVSTNYKTGEIAFKSGADYSGIMVFDITVKGKGGHGAIPHKAIDPIVCSASMIMELQTLISRESPPFEPAVLTIGTIHAGTKRNIIPDTAKFCGTIRTFSESLQTHLKKRVLEVAKAVATSFRAQVDVFIEQSYPSGYNNPELTNLARSTFEDIFGAKSVIEQVEPTMYSEDFSYYQQKVPGLYIHLGVRPTKQKNMQEIHSSQFQPDEAALKVGISAHCGFVFSANNSTKHTQPRH